MVDLFVQVIVLIESVNAGVFSALKFLSPDRRRPVFVGSVHIRVVPARRRPNVCLLAVPTFVSFLLDVDSPYEVHDYVRMYLGETKQAADFSKQFIEKRIQMRTQNNNQHKEVRAVSHAEQRSLCYPLIIV